MIKFIKIHEKRIFGGAVLLLFAANFIIWPSIFALEKKPELAVYFFDVGQGDAIFIESKDGTQILIDGGPSSQILSRLGKVMPFYDRSIDIVILTHPHADHVSGLIDVLKKYKVEAVFESGVDYHTAETTEFEKIIQVKNIRKIIVDKPASISFFNGASLKFIYPDKSFLGETLKNVHDAALVAELEFDGIKILFMSDAEKKVEQYLAANSLIGDIDILKTGHHGSKTSSNGFFLDGVKPEYAIISSGRKNRYGHPAPEVLARLAFAGAQIFRTDINGTVRLNINNGELSWKLEK